MSLASLAATSGVRTMGVAIRGDASSLTRTLATSAAEVDAWEKKTSGSAARFGAGWKIATAGVILGIVAVAAGLVAAALGAVQFEKNMRNVNSLLQLNTAQFQQLSTAVLDVARTVPQTAENLAAGLYDIASSGFDGAQGLLVLTAAAKAASAGLSQTDTAAGVITSVLNAYGLSAASAADVSDVLFSTVNYGVVTFDELASTMGNVVGLASSARVPIDDVGSALATMTLAGVGAAEASTSLNRVIQGIIQPSDALAAAMKNLGYESGLQALQTKGLFGVMEDLRGVTQGNAEAYLQLFPEIRAARGAFALAANDGQTYARIQGQISDETSRSGSTQKAFAEQMKSTAAKWAIFTSSMKANSIEVGQTVLPVFNAALDAINPLANEVIPALSAAWAVLMPYMRTAKDIGADLWKIFEAIYNAAEPIAGALLKMGGAIAGLGLDILLGTLKAVTGALADNQVVAVGLAAFFAAQFLPRIAEVVGGIRAMSGAIAFQITEQIRYQQVLATGAILNGQYVGTLSRMRLAGLAASTSLRGLAAAARVAGVAFAAAGGWVGVVIAAIVALVYWAKEAGNGMKDLIKEITGKTNNLDLTSLETASTKLQAIKDGLDGVPKAYENVNLLTNGVSELRVAFGEYKNNKEIEATGDALAVVNEKITNTKVNISALANETGVSFGRLQQIAQTQGIDLTEALGTEKAGAARDQIVAYLKDLEKQTGVSTATMADGWHLTVDQIEEFSKAVDDATQKAAQAFASATDVLGTWKPNIGVDEERQAVEGLTEARKNLREVQKDDTTTSKQLEAARKGVTDAEATLADAQKTKAEGTLTAFYKNAISTSKTFSTNLDKAVQLGLNPEIVTKLLQEGPAQAGPIVQQMVNDNSGALIEMVNAAEKTLGDINQRVVEQARLTAIAVNSGTDELSKQLPDALRISSASASGMTTDQIAKATGLSPEAVKKVAANFGITLLTELQQAPVPYSIDYTAKLGLSGDDGAAAGKVYGDRFFNAMQQAIRGGTKVPTPETPTGANAYHGFAGGTPYVLPGYTPGRDVHNFYSPTAGWLGLSGGEGIGRPEFVAALGAGRWNAINYAARTGGIDAVRRMLAGPNLGHFAQGTSSLRIQTVAVPVTSTHRTEAPMFVDKMYVRDPGDGQRVARQTRALNQIGGRRGN